MLASIIIVIFNFSLHSQVVIERSKEKINISGIPYYIHLVKKGETAYSISRAYGVTVDELTKENPPALYGVNEGQTLRIPVKPMAEPAPQVQLPPRDESKFIYHKLKPGETVFYLSRAYGVSENEVITSNPRIEINKMPVGAEIAIPRRNFMNDRQKFNEPASKYLYHKVVQGESLASIAEFYGLTLRQLRRENRDLRFPQVGDYVRVPNQNLAIVKIIEPVADDTVQPVIEEPVVVFERPAGYTPIVNLKGSLNVAVLLPFYLKENSQRAYYDSITFVKGKRIRRLIHREPEWVFGAERDFVEMYQGILLAADTLRSMGLDINLNVYDIKSDTVELSRLIKSGKLGGMDLIIGPIYSGNLSRVAAYASPRGIPVVSPVPLFNNNVVINNPDLFLANSSLEVVQRSLAQKVSELYDHNFIFVHADTAGNDPDVKNFKKMIIDELSNKMPFEEIRFKEFLFYSRSTFGNDSIVRLSHALSDNTKNLIVIACEDAPVISETIQNIHAFSKKHDIKVFGYPELRNQVNLNPEYYFDLGLMLYSPSWIDFSKKDVQEFNSDFRKKFLTEPSPVSYAWQGYDIAYYFLSGLAIHGRQFISHPEIHNPDLLETEYDFRRKQITDGFENQKLYFIRYNKDYRIELVEDNSSLTEK